MGFRMGFLKGFWIEGLGSISFSFFVCWRIGVYGEKRS